MSSTHSRHREHSTPDDVVAEMIVQAWKDPSVRNQLTTHPKQTLQQMGFFIPDDVQVTVLYEQPKSWTIVLPAPPANLAQLKEEELHERALQAVHHVRRLEKANEEEGLWELFSHRYWPSHHEE